MNGYILKKAKSPFTVKQLDMLARAKQAKERKRVEHINQLQIELDQITGTMIEHGIKIKGVDLASVKELQAQHSISIETDSGEVDTNIT